MKALQRGMKKTVNKSKVNPIMSVKVAQSYESKMWLQSEREIRVGHHCKREGGTGDLVRVMVQASSRCRSGGVVVRFGML